MHRVLVAKDDESIARGLSLVHAYPYAFFTPGILMGVTKAAIYPTQEGSAFALMADEFTNFGGFYAFVGAFQHLVSIVL